MSVDEEPLVNRFATRRKSVFAETYDPENDADEDEGAVAIFPKSDEQRSRLIESVKNILLFRSLDKEQMNQVLDAMFEKKVTVDEVVIHQGDDGDNFYVIESAATITAATVGQLWAMDRQTFRRILLKSAFRKRKMYESLLNTVPMLKTLQSYERLNLADALAPKTFKADERIIQQGKAFFVSLKNREKKIVKKIVYEMIAKYDCENLI
ncbi:cAMP-dependent protein kinase type II regulatory subunit, partial [Pseudolycoriella hygida]